MTVRRMVNPVMTYAWGSRDAIANLQGRPATGVAEAELWMGAHPQAPSELEGGSRRHGPGGGSRGHGPGGGSSRQGLDSVIAADPVGVLGQRCFEQFGPRLPFLLKVLAAEHPLSLQVHPDDQQARRGFAAEEAAGIDRLAPERNYRDPYGKPEMLIALTDFHVLQGFRPADEAAAALSALHVEGFDPLIEALQGGTPTGEVFLRLIDWPADDRAGIVADVSAACSTRAGDGVDRWITALAATYPRDPGVVGVLLLNYLTLRPLQGLYVRPGQIHGYLHGTGIEVLGGSDNVIRGGLTPKHVSTEGLREILHVEAAAPGMVTAVGPATGAQTWPTPQPEFALHRQQVAGKQRLEVGGPAVLLCLDGTLEISDRDGGVTLGPGESAFAFAGSDLAVSGRGVLVRANPGTG
jgi:mannose-6-phosphate isomerase